MKLYEIIIFFLFFDVSVQAKCQLVQDKDRLKMKQLLGFLNEKRREVQKKSGGMMFRMVTSSDDDARDVFFLQREDESLKVLAEEAMMSCNETADSTDSDGFRKVVFRIDESKDDSRSTEMSLCLDVFGDWDVDEFLNASSPHRFREAQEKLLYENQTRIGCAFKVCTSGPDHRIFNQLCLLGRDKKLKSSKKTCNGLCREVVPTTKGSKFRSRMLDHYNAIRRAYAKFVGKSKLYKMMWDEELERKAREMAEKCQLESPDPSHIATYHNLLMLPLLPHKIGENEGRKFLASQEDERIRMDHTSIWWNHTRLGCARLAVKCRPKSDVICNINTAIPVAGSYFIEGPPCSECPGECDDGLCLGDPNEDLKQTSPRMFSPLFWILPIFFVFPNTA